MLLKFLISTIRSPVVTITYNIKNKKLITTKIGEGYVVKAKVGEKEENTEEGRIRRTSKEVVG